MVANRSEAHNADGVSNVNVRWFVFISFSPSTFLSRSLSLAAKAEANQFYTLKIKKCHSPFFEGEIQSPKNSHFMICDFIRMNNFDVNI